jgi:hypothetical protein
VNGQLVLVVASRKPHVLLSSLIYDLTRVKNRSLAPAQVRSLCLTKSGFSSLIEKLECDKSFTRSDALAKHMRLLHNISPPSLGRGNRKRKRAASVAISEANNDADASCTVNGPTPHNTFKIEPGSDPEDGGLANESVPGNVSFINGNKRHSPDPKLAKDEDSDEDEPLPAYLLALQDPVTGLIMGRSPSMVRYLLMKARHRYALEQHGALIEELRVVRWELKQEQECKERTLDEVLKNDIG